MQSEWSAWLAAERAAGRGGIVWPEPIVRGLPFTMLLPIPLDVSGDSFKLGFASSPDSANLLTLSGGAGITVGSFADGFTIVTGTLTDTQVGTIGAAQTDGDGDGLAEVLCDLLWQQGGTGAWRRAMVLSIPISGKITDD